MNKPQITFRSGNISATIWKNGTGSDAWFSVNIVRNYKEGDEWKQGSSFRHSDLPVVEMLSRQAFLWILDVNVNGSQGDAASS